jgi:hypothetical protein
MAVTRLSDVIVPENFTPYSMQLTREKSAIIQSGAAVEQAFLNEFLAGGGMTVQVPSFKDLANDVENVSDDNPANTSTPQKISTAKEVAIRLSRNQSWSSMDLNQALAGVDPMDAIAQRVSAYWVRRQQAAFVSVMKGIFGDNDAAPSGTEHVLGDLTLDVKGGAYSAGVTDFSAANFIDALQTMGDASSVLSMTLVHSVVYTRMQKNNLIDFIPDSEGNLTIPTFMGKRVVVDDGMPSPSAGVYETWIFGPGAIALGMGSPKVPTEVDRKPEAGTGGGQEILYNRVEWCIHPVGHAWVGATTASGGPANSVLDDNNVFQRVYPERKQIAIARLITREF